MYASVKVIRQRNQDTPAIGFGSIQLLKDQTLGIGSYGIVCKALCDDLLCAAKIIHQTLIDQNAHQQIDRQREHRLPIHRFEQECEFMSAIRHPNIVQFLGTHQDPQTGLPVLLMELMDDSLTHFLESSQDVVPYHIQVNFCRDIALAISYLHSNKITHRDLSSNNVLLRGNVIVKVTDFGMAKLGGINPQVTRGSFTMCPGTDAYMPPEAVKDSPVYTEKIDSFAIGTLIIQILTRCFPKPGDRHKIVHTTDPRFPTIEVRTSEIERRQNHIRLVDPKHPLLPIALDCLKDSDVERPSAQELCHRVATLKETPQFTESARRAQERSGNTTKERKEDLQQVQDKDQEIRQMRQEHAKQIQELQQIIESQNNNLQQNSDIIKNKEQKCQQLKETIRVQHRKLAQVIRELENSQQEIAQFQKQIHEQEQQLQKRKPPTEVLAKQLQKKKLPTELLAKPQPSLRDSQKQIQELEQLQKKKPPNEVLAKLKRKPQIEVPQPSLRDPEKQIQELEQQLQKSNPPTELLAKPQPSLNAEPPETHLYDTITTRATATRDSFTLSWREGNKAPRTMARVSNAVVDGEMVYFSDGEKAVYSYNSRDESWEQLPDCLNLFSSLVVIQNSLTAIGGCDIRKELTNQLLSLTGDGRRSKIWREVFPPMPTKRTYAISVCTRQALIVVGGRGQDTKILRTVEVMDIDTKQWTSAEKLPEPLYFASITICHDYVYIGGGVGDSRGIRAVYTCILTDLFLSLESRSLRKRIARSLATSPTGIWSKIADLPISLSTCITLHDRLLAIGGSDSKHTPISDVRIYHPTSGTWEVISKMNSSRGRCFAAVLPTNELMVVGGYTSTTLQTQFC